MENVSPEITRQLIGRQLEAWRTQLEDWRITARVADLTEEGDALKVEKERVAVGAKKCVLKIEALEKMLAELPVVQQVTDTRGEHGELKPSG